MSKKKKALLITAGLLILIGLCIGSVGIYAHRLINQPKYYVPEERIVPAVKLPKNNAEKLNHVPGYNEVLYRLQLVMGDNHYKLAEDPHDAHAKEAFRHYVNAADMSASLHDNEAYSN